MAEDYLFYKTNKVTEVKPVRIYGLPPGTTNNTVLKLASKYGSVKRVTSAIRSTRFFVVFVRQKDADECVRTMEGADWAAEQLWVCSKRSAENESLTVGSALVWNCRGKDGRVCDISYWGAFPNRDTVAITLWGRGVTAAYVIWALGESGISAYKLRHVRVLREQRVALVQFHCAETAEYCVRILDTLPARWMIPREDRCV